MIDKDYTPSLLDWLAFMACVLWNPVLLVEIVGKVQRESAIEVSE